MLFGRVRFRRIEKLLHELLQEVQAMAVDQATFDQHLQELNTAINDLIAAVEAQQAAAPDLTPESEAVKAATDRVKAATDALTADDVAVTDPSGPTTAPSGDEPQVNPE
jgi:predicted RecB family endonuclease